MQRLSAALIFFTRLPLWRIVSPSPSAYTDVVVFWPLVGWLTGGVTALAMFGLSLILPWTVALVLAIVLRLLITGALHEDGLADFCDAFGCGGDRGRVLAIMKDSHIGTYGVIGLIVYYILVVAVLSALPVWIGVCVFFAADSFGKLCAAQLINFLPYARPEGAKNGISYTPMSVGKWILCFIFGVIPLGISAFLIGLTLLWACILPVVVMLWLVWLMKRRIGGYTGDCCGAADMICELAFLLGASAIFYYG